MDPAPQNQNRVRMLFIQLSFPTGPGPVSFTSFSFLPCEQAKSHFSNGAGHPLETCLSTTSGGIDKQCVSRVMRSHTMTVIYLCVSPGQNCLCFKLKELRVSQMAPLNIVCLLEKAPCLGVERWFGCSEWLCLWFLNPRSMNGRVPL